MLRYYSRYSLDISTIMRNFFAPSVIYSSNNFFFNNVWQPEIYQSSRHAGSGSIFEALRMGKPLIVVVNEDLMNNQPSEWSSRRIGREKAPILCSSSRPPRDHRNHASGLTSSLSAWRCHACCEAYQHIPWVSIWLIWTCIQDLSWHNALDSCWYVSCLATHFKSYFHWTVSDTFSFYFYFFPFFLNAS